MPGKANTRFPFTVHMVTSGPELFPERLLYIPSTRKPSGVLAEPEIAREPNAWKPGEVASARSPTGTVAPAANPKVVRRWALAGVAVAAIADRTSALPTRIRCMRSFLLFLQVMVVYVTSAVEKGSRRATG